MSALLATSPRQIVQVIQEYIHRSAVLSMTRVKTNLVAGLFRGRDVRLVVGVIS
jgi:hypothetical protein